MRSNGPDSRKTTREIWTRRVSALGGPALLLLLCIALLWKITLTRQYTWLNSGDLVNQVLPWFQFEAMEWRHGRFPLWDPYHWAGQSLIGQDQPGVFYPLNWILFLMPMSGGQIAKGVLNWYLLVIHYMGALFCYLLARDLGRSRIASVISGMAFSFLGYMAATTWPQMLNGAVWMPLVFLMFFRVMRDRRSLLSSALCGAFLGVSYLSGHHQIPIFGTLTILGCWGFLIFVGGQLTLPGALEATLFGRFGPGLLHPRSRLGLCFVLFGVCLFTFAAPQLLPGIEYFHLALRWVGSQNTLAWGDKVPYLVHVRYSLNPASLVKLVVANLPGQGELFAGFAVPALSLLGIAAFRRQREVRVLCAVSISAFLFALGGYAAFEGIVYALIPGLDKARSPTAALSLAQLACAVLAAFGVDAVRSPSAELSRVMRAIGAGVAAIAALLWATLLVLSAVQPDRATSLIYFGSAGLAAVVVSVTLLLASREVFSSRLVILLLAGAVFFEAGSVTGYVYPHREEGWPILDKLHAFDDIAGFLRARPDLERIRADRDAIPFNFGDWYGIEQIDGYCGVTKSIFDIYGDDHARMLLGETFWIGKSSSRPGQEPVFKSASGLIVFKNQDAFPRAWAVHKLQPVSNAAGMLQAFDEPLNTVRETAFITGSMPALDACQDDEVRVISRTPQTIVLRARMACKGMVVLSDSYFPGWRAKIDGKTTKLYAVDTAIMGVVANSGTHRIQIEYVPVSFYSGVAAFSAGSILLACIGFLPYFRRSHD